MPDVVIFDSGDAGMGHALGDGRGYNFSYNWDSRPLGTSAPANAPIYYTLTAVAASTIQKIVSAFEWQTVAGIPFVTFFGGDVGGAAALAGSFADGAATVAQIAVAPFTSAALYRNDGSNADTAMIYACNGDDQSNLYQFAISGTGLGVGSAAGHSIKADLLFRVGSDLWMAQGYKVRKCTTDADPGLSASWPIAIPVGLPDYPVNAGLPLGGSPFAAKGDGLWRYNPNPSVAEYQNVVPVVPHPDNGKGSTVDGRGRIYFTTQESIIVVTFGQQSQQTPASKTIIDRNTPFGRISTMASDGEYVYAPLEPGAIRTKAGLGLKVFSEDGGVFTDITTNVTDGKYATLGDVTLLSGVAPDRIWIGADEPFLGVHVQMGIGNTRTAAASGVGFSGAYGTTAPSTYTTTTAFRDSTQMLLKDGLITVQSNTAGALFPAVGNSPGGAAPWVKTTVNSSEKYWFRLTPGAVLTGAKIREISLVPFRPPLDQDLFPNSAYAIAGCFPKILVGKWVTTEELVWHDVWTLDSAQIDAITVGRGGMTADVTSERQLYCFSGEVLVTVIAIGPEANPIRQPWPKLGDYGDATVAGSEHLKAFTGAVCPNGPNKIWSVPGKVVIDISHLQADDNLALYYHWDADAPKVIKADQLRGSPVTVENLEGRGRVLYTYLAYSDGSRDAVAPQLTSIRIPEGEWRDEGVAGLLKGDISSPQTI